MWSQTIVWGDGTVGTEGTGLFGPDTIVWGDLER
jgi:hypothetical protein